MDDSAHLSELLRGLKAVKCEVHRTSLAYKRSWKIVASTNSLFLAVKLPNGSLCTPKAGPVALGSIYFGRMECLVMIRSNDFLDRRRVRSIYLLVNS